MPHTIPTVSADEVLRLLGESLDARAESLETIEGGQIARAYSFTVQGRPYVLRFNADNMDADFEKEVFIARSFGSPSIPIPAVIRHGRWGDLQSCINEKAEGVRVDRLSREEMDQATPAMVAVLSAIHAADVSPYDGWGLFDNRGRGFFSSWRACLASVWGEERADGFFGKWHCLFDETFLERDVFDGVSRRMERLLKYRPEERYLVHGGFGFSNLMVRDGAVTAVIDWLDAKYGDFLFDVAWLDFWDPDRRYPDAFLLSYQESGIDVPAFRQRIECYQCYMALDGMRFFAHANKPEAYAFVKERVAGIGR